MRAVSEPSGGLYEFPVQAILPPLSPYGDGVMKIVLTITAAGLIALAGAATAGERLKSSAYGGCGYGASLKTATTVPAITPVPTRTASQTKTTPKTGG